MAKLVSKIYGDALFESAVEGQILDQVAEEVSALETILEENADLTALLNHPKIVKEEKTEVLKNIFSDRVSGEVMGFLVTVVEKDRQDELKAICDYFLARVKEYKKIGVAQVTSAVALTDAQKLQVKARLLETTSYVEFEMNYFVDPALIGGLVIRIGDRVVDSSVRTQLGEITKDLMKLQLA